MASPALASVIQDVPEPVTAVPPLLTEAVPVRYHMVMRSDPGSDFEIECDRYLQDRDRPRRRRCHLDLGADEMVLMQVDAARYDLGRKGHHLADDVPIT